MTRKLAAALLWASLHATAPIAAQTRSRTFELALSRSVGASAAAHPPPCGNPCTIHDVLAPIDFTVAEIELTAPLRTSRWSGLEYFGRAIPIALVQRNPTQAAVLTSQGWALSTSTTRSATIGVGLKPIGLRGWVGGALRLEADVAAGIYRFGTPLLASNGTRVNFTYEFGLGLRASRAGWRGVAIGYRRHHVSNAGLGDVNPGLNSHLLFLGVPLG